MPQIYDQRAAETKPRLLESNASELACACTTLKVGVLTEQSGRIEHAAEIAAREAL